MPKVMMTIRWEGEAPTVAEIARHYGLQPGEIDDEFGVVALEPDRPGPQDYTFLVEQEVAARIAPEAGWDVRGPYSNPKIEPFGPPEK